MEGKIPPLSKFLKETKIQKIVENYFGISFLFFSYRK